MSQSNSSRRSRNGSIRTARPGAPCSRLPDNHITFSEQRSRSLRKQIFSAHVVCALPDIEELKAIIGLWVSLRGTRHQQRDGAWDLMLPQQSPRKIAPALRIID